MVPEGRNPATSWSMRSAGRARHALDRSVMVMPSNTGQRSMTVEQPLDRGLRKHTFAGSNSFDLLALPVDGGAPCHRCGLTLAQFHWLE